MNRPGIAAAAISFACIGMSHPIVTKAEYDSSPRCRPSLVSAEHFTAPLSAAALGPIGRACLWCITELKEQESRSVLRVPGKSEKGAKLVKCMRQTACRSSTQKTPAARETFINLEGSGCAVKASVKFKICVDLLMTAALYASMAYMLIGEEAHEWIGSGLALLFVLHNALNRKWYAALFTGRCTPLRAFQTAVNMLCLVSMAAAAVSGAALSRYLYDISFLSGGASLARTVHMLSAYWGYCFVSLHIGLHWSMVLGIVKNAAAPDVLRRLTPVLRTAGAAAALLGAYALMRHNLLDYMFLRSRFVFFDTERPLYLFFLDYALIMAFWAWIAHYARLLLIKASVRKGK